MELDRIKQIADEMKSEATKIADAIEEFEAENRELKKEVDRLKILMVLLRKKKGIDMCHECMGAGVLEVGYGQYRCEKCAGNGVICEP